ncbi:MAG: phage terminase small subunit P27 family [Rhodothermales bacterium]
MGRRGPAPKPTKLKLLQGTYRKDRANTNEPEPEAAVPKCPSFLKGEARREWRRIVPELQEMGLLSRIDRAALCGYCASWETLVESDKVISAEGRTIVNAKGQLVAHPEMAIRSRAMDQLRGYMVEFGMTPASRARIHVPEKGNLANPFADILKDADEKGPGPEAR